MNRTPLTSDDYFLPAVSSIAGMREAMYDGDDLYYFASDHLSSDSLVMNASGTCLLVKFATYPA